jgi:serine/threonine-protein kinase
LSEAENRLRSALADRYRLERRLGEGGTATVYLAEDLRHGRRVALKVLRPELAAVVGAERFLAEVRTTASLHHPHILPLFDSGEAGGFLYYAMPHVAGESLRDKLDREGQLPIDEAARIASGVASALDYAHRSGVLHRDIKPANILLQDGQPVISDFGIALALGAGAGSRLTETGLSVGTPHYMSPEQATGEERIGPTADVYALGCVLYEMLAGEPPYTGRTPQAILGKIVLGKLVPVSEHRPSAPAHVAAVVAKALERMPADRFQSAGEFARALGEPGFRWPRSSGTRVRARTLAITGAVAAFALVGFLAYQAGAARGAGPEPTGEIALSLYLPSDQLLAMNNPSSLEVSPDGSRVAYVAQRGGNTHVFVRAMDDFEATQVPGTEGATSIFFSPNGDEVGFHANGALRRVALAGGIPVRIADVTEPPVGASWGVDGTILYAPGS